MAPWSTPVAAPERRRARCGPISDGPDIAKNVFQAHGVDAAGGAVLGRKLRRGEEARRGRC